MRALVLFREAGAHVVVPVPSLTDLTRALSFGSISAACASIAILAHWRRWPRTEVVVSTSALALILGWWLCHPLCLFLISLITGQSVFVERYLSLALPGAALTATLGVAMFAPARYWKTMAITIGLGVLIFLGHWNRLWPDHHNSDWRSAAQAVNSQALGPDVPVICPSPFIEARLPVWQPDYPISSFLYSHLLLYKLHGHMYPFPFDTSAEVERYAAMLSRTELAGSHHFVIYGGDHIAPLWRDWFRARPEFAGWNIREAWDRSGMSTFSFLNNPTPTSRNGPAMP